jgi:hypothetical protein
LHSRTTLIQSRSKKKGAPPKYGFNYESALTDAVVRSVYLFWSMAMHPADLSLLAQLDDGNVNEELFFSVRYAQ